MEITDTGKTHLRVIWKPPPVSSQPGTAQAASPGRSTNVCTHTIRYLSISRTRWQRVLVQLLRFQSKAKPGLDLIGRCTLRDHGREPPQQGDCIGGVANAAVRLRRFQTAHLGAELLTIPAQFGRAESHPVKQLPLCEPFPHPGFPLPPFHSLVDTEEGREEFCPPRRKSAAIAVTGCGCGRGR